MGSAILHHASNHEAESQGQSDSRDQYQTVKSSRHGRRDEIVQILAFPVILVRYKRDHIRRPFDVGDGVHIFATPLA